MDIGVILPVKAAYRLDDRERLLGSRSIIQVDQRPAVDGLSQGRKIGPQPLYIQERFGRVYGSLGHLQETQLQFSALGHHALIPHWVPDQLYRRFGDITD